MASDHRFEGLGVRAEAVGHSALAGAFLSCLFSALDEALIKFVQQAWSN